MIRITADSTCDLGENIQKRGIGIKPLSVILGETAYSDGVDIVPQDIFKYVEATGQLPKTAAPSIADYEDFFRPYVEAGDTVIHFNISSKASSSYSYAAEAAKSFGGKVFAVDSKALSTGQGLVILLAADLRDAGASAEEIVEKVSAVRPKVNTSFVPDRLDYLYKGGRCSRMALYGANLLKIHPLIEMEDGREYWAFDDQQDIRMLSCNSIYADPLTAYEALEELRESMAEEEVEDRSQYL